MECDSLSTNDGPLSLDRFYSEFSSLIDQFIQLRSEDKLFLANKVLVRLEEGLKFFSGREGKERMQELHDQFNSRVGDFLAQFKTEIQELKVLLQDFSSTEGWNLVKEADGVKTFYKHESSTPVHSIRLEGVVESPLFDVTAVVYEADLYKNWWPLVKESRQICQLSKFRKQVYMRADMPWPVWDRDVFLHGYGVDMLEEDTVVVMVHSSDTEEVAIPSRHVRMICSFGGFLAKPISATATKVIMLANVDPKMSYIPYTFLNLATKQLAHLMFQMLRRQCQKISGSEYEKRIKENPQVYSEIQQRLQLYFSTVATES